MKKYILSVVLSIILGSAYAQDPQLSAPNVTPSPALVNGPVSVSVNFYNSSTVPINYSDPNNTTIISFSLNKIKPTLDASGNPVVTGAGAMYFNWSVACTNCGPVPAATDIWEVYGVQKETIPGSTIFAQTGGPISIAGTVIGAATQAESNAKNGVGFNANITPATNQDIDLTPASNNQSTYAPTNGTLPVTLTSFNAIKEGKVAQLAWATTEETNSDHFEIQRSSDGKSWLALGNVASGGESKNLRKYTYTDIAPQNGENLYRLKMIDKDLTFAYSRIQAVRFEGGQNAAYVYPNPSSDRVFLNTTDIKTVKEAVVLDMNGRSVLKSAAVADGLDVSKLAAGSYILKVSGRDGSSSVHKFVIAR